MNLALVLAALVCFVATCALANVVLEVATEHLSRWLSGLFIGTFLIIVFGGTTLTIWLVYLSLTGVS